jgi:hypothetical protein
MDKHLLIVLATVVILALLRVAVWGIVQHRRRADVTRRFTPRVRPNPLSHQQRLRFANAWRLIEDRFPEDPALALSQADHQVVEVMKARGYPVAALEQHPDEVARENPEIVENFRAARRILRAHGKQTKELLHQAMIHYRALFDDLVEVPVTEWQQAGS